MAVTIENVNTAARRSLVPQAEAIDIAIESLSPDLRAEFLKLFNQLVIARGPEAKNEILINMGELLDPDAGEGLAEIPAEEWSQEPSSLEKLERLKGRFASFVAVRMKEKGINQQQLAQSLDMSASNVCQVISGRHKPQPKTLERLSNALDCRVHDLWAEG